MPNVRLTHHLAYYPASNRYNSEGSDEDDQETKGKPCISDDVCIESGQLVRVRSSQLDIAGGNVANEEVREETEMGKDPPVVELG